MKSPRILYIHGWGGNENSNTAIALKAAFPKAKVVCPAYDPLEPDKSLIILDKIYKADSIYDTIVIGNSLGGWYAEQLSTFNGGRAFLFYNPAVKPWLQLSKYNLQKNVLEKYKTRNDWFAFYTEVKKKPTTYQKMFLATDDEVLDYRIAENEWLLKQTQYLTGGHRITPENFKIIREEIQLLINSF